MRHLVEPLEVGRSGPQLGVDAPCDRVRVVGHLLMVYPEVEKGVDQIRIVVLLGKHDPLADVSCSLGSYIGHYRFTTLRLMSSGSQRSSTSIAALSDLFTLSS